MRVETCCSSMALDDHMVARDLTFDEKHILDPDSFGEVKGKWVGLPGHIHIATGANI